MSAPLQLPVPLPSAGGWVLSDFRKLTLQSQPAAGSLAVATGPQLAGYELWLIDHGVISCSSSSQTSLRLYDSSASSAGTLWDGSDDGNFDVADWPGGLLLLPSEQLTAVWSNAADGSQGILRIQFRVLRNTAG